MSTTQRQSAGSAFRPPAYAHAPARRSPVTSPDLPAIPSSALRPRNRVQTGTLTLMVMVALVVVVGGLVYLSGYAQLTQEGYRRTKLLGTLKQEQEVQQQWLHRKSLLNTPAVIEKKAAELGMMPADDKQTLTVGGN